jgi:hypothetical protein
MLEYVLYYGRSIFMGCCFIFLYAFLCIAESLNLLFISLQMPKIVATNDINILLIACSIYVYLFMHIGVRLYHLRKMKDVKIWLLVSLMSLQICLYGLLYSKFEFSQQFMFFLFLSNAYNFYEIFLKCINRNRRIEPFESDIQRRNNTASVAPYPTYNFKVEAHECQDGCKDCPCSICLENMTSLVRLICGHSLHEDCIKKLMQTTQESKIKCPLCRHETSLSEPVVIIV